MSDSMRELYQEVILDHNRRPRNFRVMEEPTGQADGNNPLCGDQITVYVTVKDGVVDDVSFQGAGCAISTASASVMTETLKGKTSEQAEALFHVFHDLITGHSDIDREDLGKLAVFSGVGQYPARVKCATLAWHTLQAALHGSQEPVSTE